MKELIYISILVLVIILIASMYKKEKMIPLNESRVVVLHYTNWCPACRQFRPTWDAVKSALKDTKIKFIERDESSIPTPGVTAYPTMTIIDAHGKRHRHVGGMSYDSLTTWITAPSYFS